MRALKVYNISASIGLLLLNLYFLPLTFLTFYSGGGSWGYGLLVIPFSLPINLLIIPAFLALKKNGRSSVNLAIINSIGFIIGLLIFYFIFSATIME